MLGVYLACGRIYRRRTQETCKAKRQEIWLRSCFLVRFHAVRQDGSDPRFSSITQRSCSERELVPKGLNGCRKALSAGQRGQEHGQASARSLHCQFSSLQQFTGNRKPIIVKTKRNEQTALAYFTAADLHQYVIYVAGLEALKCIIT